MTGFWVFNFSEDLKFWFWIFFILRRNLRKEVPKKVSRDWIFFTILTPKGLKFWSLSQICIVSLNSDYFEFNLLHLALVWISIRNCSHPSDLVNQVYYFLQLKLNIIFFIFFYGSRRLSSHPCLKLNFFFVGFEIRRLFEALDQSGKWTITASSSNRTPPSQPVKRWGPPFTSRCPTGERRWFAPSLAASVSSTTAFPTQSDPCDGKLGKKK